MDNQRPSGIASRPTVFSAQSKRQAAQKSVAHLLDDKKALAEWTNNIEKIRQKESKDVV
jgi:hypothetical protein